MDFMATGVFKDTTIARSEAHDCEKLRLEVVSSAHSRFSSFQIQMPDNSFGTNIQTLVFETLCMCADGLLDPERGQRGYEFQEGCHRWPWKKRVNQTARGADFAAKRLG